MPETTTPAPLMDSRQAVALIDRLHAVYVAGSFCGCDHPGSWRSCTYFQPVRVQCVCHKLIAVWDVTGDPTYRLVVFDWFDDGPVAQLGVRELARVETLPEALTLILADARFCHGETEPAR